MFFIVICLASYGCGAFTMWVWRPATPVVDEDVGVLLLRRVARGDRSAGKELASAPGAQGIIVYVLCSARRDKTEGCGLLGPDDAVEVVTLVRALPQKVSPVVLLALTYRLDDESVGAVSGETGVLWFRRESIGFTPPVRDVARNALRQRLGVDHGYDAAAWRWQIMLSYESASSDKQ